MIFGNLQNSMIRPTRVDHPGWSGGFLPLGNVHFRGVSKCVNNIFIISQVLVAGTESSRPLGVTKLMKMLKNYENHGFSRFSVISWNWLTRSLRVGHPRWSGEFFPLGNVRFRGVWKSLETIFNIFQVFVPGTESSRPLGVVEIMKMLKIDENVENLWKFWKLMKIMDFQDFRWFHEIEWPDHCGWATPDGQGSFPLGNVRFRGVWKSVERNFNIFLVFVAGTESSRPLGVADWS